MSEDVIDDFDESKTDRWAWFPLYVDDWEGGTKAFTNEQEGFFLRFCRCQWSQRGDLRDDIKWLAKALHSDPRTVRRLRQFLVDEGKLVLRDGMIFNPRMKREIAAKFGKDRAKIGGRSGEDRPKIARRSAEDRAKIGERFAESPTKSTAPPHLALVPIPEPEPEPLPEPSGEVGESVSVAEAAAAPERIGFDILQQKLIDAASDAIAKDDVTLRLAELSFPIMWLDQGCDLDLDILPTIRAVCGRRHDQGIRSWKYFNDAVAKAKATRLAGLPAATPDVTARSRGTVSPQVQAMYDRIKEAAA